MNKKNTVYYEKIGLILLLLGSLVSVGWSLSKYNLPVFDDYILLNQARFTEYRDLFHFSPSMSYNDRPLRMILLKLLNDLCGSNFQTYHVVLVAIHLLNVFLSYKVCAKLFQKNEYANLYAIMAASIIGMYPYSHMTVVWVANTPDMQCATFILLTLLFYLRAKDFQTISKQKIVYAVLSVASFYLALRCKEMALTVPIILVIYECYLALNEKKKVKVSGTLIAEIVIMIVFVVILFAGKGKSLSTPDAIYYQSFSIKDWIVDAIKYLFLFFDWGNGAFYFDDFSTSAAFGVGLFALAAVYSIWRILKHKDWSILLAIISLGASLGIVLPLVNSVHRTYLYIPAFFVGVLFALCLMKLNKKSIVVGIGSMGVLVLVFLTNFTAGNRVLVQYWFEYCQNESQQSQQIVDNVEKPKDYASIYIKGAKDEYNIFTYGPGEAIIYLFENNTYNIELVDEFPQSLKENDVCILYDKGNITQINK